jgi:hypothetical protein
MGHIDRLWDGGMQRQDLHENTFFGDDWVISPTQLLG